MATLQFIPNAVSKSSAAAQLTMADVPQEVRDDVEAAYKALKTNPGRFRVEFPTLAELNTYISQIQAYCSLRVVDKDGNPTDSADGVSAPIRFRKSPSRGLKPTQMDFRITEVQTENEKTTEEIRDAADAVKDAAKPAAKK